MDSAGIPVGITPECANQLSREYKELKMEMQVVENLKKFIEKALPKNKNKKSKKFTMGYNETLNANELGAVESIVFSDKIIQDNNEQEIMDFLNDESSPMISSRLISNPTFRKKIAIKKSLMIKRKSALCPAKVKRSRFQKRI